MLDKNVLDNLFQNFEDELYGQSGDSSIILKLNIFNFTLIIIYLSMEIKKLLSEEIVRLLKINSSNQPWELPFATALAVGSPLLLGWYWDNFNYGVLVFLGSLTFLYMPNTQIGKRMLFMTVCGVGLIFCYALGLFCHFAPELMSLAIIIITISVTIVWRYYVLGPPGPLFFILASAIGMFSSGNLDNIFTHIKLVSLGVFIACLVGYIYSLYILRSSPLTSPPPVLSKPVFSVVFFESLVIGVCVGVSLVIANFFNLYKPTWVLVSCLIVIQGSNFQAAWTKHIHRLVGTLFGLILTWALLLFDFSSLNLCFLMTALIFIIQSLTVRNYGIAVIFITPFTIFIVEITFIGISEPTNIIWTRFIDTFLGCMVGIIGATIIQSKFFRSRFQS